MCLVSAVGKAARFFYRLKLKSGPKKGGTDEAEAVFRRAVIGILVEGEAGAVVSRLRTH